MAESFDELNESIREAKKINRASGIVNTRDSFDEFDDADTELAEQLTNEGFEIPISLGGSSAAEYASDFELAYQSFIETAKSPEFLDDNDTRGEQISGIISYMDEKLDEVQKDARRYEMEFLHDNLKTISSAFLDIQDGYVRASLDQQAEKQKAEEIRANPRDIYIGGSESDEGVEDLEAKRKEIRDNIPPGKRPIEGPSEEEIEQNNQSIKESLERIKNREDRGIQ